MSLRSPVNQWETYSALDAPRSLSDTKPTSSTPESSLPKGSKRSPGGSINRIRGSRAWLLPPDTRRTVLQDQKHGIGLWFHERRLHAGRSVLHPWHGQAASACRPFGEETPNVSRGHMTLDDVTVHHSGMTRRQRGRDSLTSAMARRRPAGAPRHRSRCSSAATVALRAFVHVRE
jgi:hypothetical protein